MRRRRDAHRGAAAGPARCGQRVREGRAPAGDWAVAAAGVARRGSTAARSPTSASAWPPWAPTSCTPRAPGATPRQRAVRGHVAEAAPGRGRGLLTGTDQRGPADYKRHLAGELTRGRCAAPPRAGGPWDRRRDDADQRHRQRRATTPGRSSRGICSCISSVTPGADRHPLGLRHSQLRHVRGAAGRGAGQELHGPGGHGGRARGPHRRGPGGRRRTRPGAAGLHRGARAAVRVLHPGHDADRPVRCWTSNPDPTEHEIREAISGQLCRCTGYQNIVTSDAVGGRPPARPRRDGSGSPA